MGQTEASQLVKLAKTGKTVADKNEDIRGYSVRTASGEEIGKVDELLVDAAEEKVRFLIVASGGFLGIGKDKAFIPVDAITAINEGDTEVLIGPTRDQVAGAPEYDPDLAEARSYYEGCTAITNFPLLEPGLLLSGISLLRPLKRAHQTLLAGDGRRLKKPGAGAVLRRAIKAPRRAEAVPDQQFKTKPD